MRFSPEHVRATAQGGASDPVWSEEERVLVRLVDELCDTATVSDALWAAVSFLANALRLAPESYAPPFPSA